MSARNYRLGARRTADIERTRARILAAARSLVAELGPETGVGKVAELAGVSRITVYNQFGTKAGLLDALAADLGPGMQAVPAEAGADPVADLRRRIEQACAAWAADPILYRRLLGRGGEAGQPEGDHALAERLAAQDRLRPGCSIREAGDVIGILTSFSAFDRLHGRGRRSPSAVAEILLRMASGVLWRNPPRSTIDAVRHKTANLDGPVHYLDFGGTGRPLLMVHGLGGSALNWMAVGPEIADSYHAIAIDLAGFGQTPLFGRRAAVGGNAELVHEFIEKVIGEPVVIMGNSMGGHIALLEAAVHPTWVSAMVLVDPAIPGVHVTRPEPAMLGVMAGLTIPGLAEILLDRRARVLGPEGLVHETLSIVCADPSRVPPEVVEAHVQLMRERDRLGRQNGRAFLQASRSIGLRMADPRFWVQVAKVRAPTLVIHGSIDALIPLAAARELVRRRPDWTLDVLEGVGHVPMMETPGLFMNALNGWSPYRIAREPETDAAVNS